MGTHGVGASDAGRFLGKLTVNLVQTNRPVAAITFILLAFVLGDTRQHGLVRIVGGLGLGDAGTLRFQKLSVNRHMTLDKPG